MQVKRSTFLALLLGFLLPLPFVLFMGLAWKSWSEERARMFKESPRLELEETWGLQTYSKKCWKGTDCESPLGCLSFSAYEREGLCSDSWCRTDLQCREGQTCQTLRTLDEGPLVRVCVDPGGRKEGEACVPAMGPEKSTCAQGLRCNDGWCGRPCEMDEPESCPEGFFCRDGLNGPSCLPTCEGRTCLEGQQCVPMEEGVSVCVKVLGENCRRTPCPEGQQCNFGPFRYTKSGVAKLKMACTQPRAGNEVACPDAGPAACQPRPP